MSYRVELAKTGRSGCSNTSCKKAESKIQKGELRQGVLVQIQEHQSMKWRHWGCVTPTVLHNWWETAGEDLDLVDGYDDLPADAQEKVKRSLEQGHVDDEDWNGASSPSHEDIEMNRYDPANPRQGMFLTKKKKKELGKDDDDDEGDKQKKKPSKKRARKDAEDEDEEAESKPARKKSRGKKAKAEEEDEAPVPAKKTSKKKAPAKKEVAEESAEESEQPAPKKTKGRKAKSAAKVEPTSDTEDVSAEEEKPAPQNKSAPKARKGRGKKAASEED